jgi:hypothetical protein
MTAQHTPGPWTVSQFCTPRASEDPLGAYLIDEIAKELGELDAKSYDAEPNSEEEQDWVDARSNKNEANAALIAAAPDLLDALECILSATCGDVGDDGYDGCVRIEAKTLERARAAIAKAGGGK